MAYMNQEKKAKIAAALKAVVPADWKYSLGVRHHSTICFTIRSAPIDLIAAWNEGGERAAFSAQERTPATRGYVQVNHYHLSHAFKGELLKTFEAIKAALDLNNHDRSDIMTDYHDVGHYIDLHIGAWDKPFVCTAQAKAA